MNIFHQRIEDRKFFEQIPIQSRSSFRKNLIKTKQLKGQQPVFYLQDYPKIDYFDFKGTKLCYHSLEKHQNPKSILFFFHGMYVHGNRSGYLAHQVANNISANVYAIDFKNAGKSEGDCPGYYESIQSLIEQAQIFMDLIMKKYNQKISIFIAGESMGGLVTFKLCLKNPQKFKGAIFLCPALRDCYQNMAYLKKLGRVMGTIFPRLKIIPQQVVGMNKYENLQFINNDKGRYLGNHPPGTPYLILKEMDGLDQQFKQMQVSYICIQGGIDTMVDPFAPLDLQKQAMTNDKTTIYFKQMWHDILTEVQIKQTSTYVAQWIGQRI